MLSMVGYCRIRDSSGGSTHWGTHCVDTRYTPQPQAKHSVHSVAESSSSSSRARALWEYIERAGRCAWAGEAKHSVHTPHAQAIGMCDGAKCGHPAQVAQEHLVPHQNPLNACLVRIGERESAVLSPAPRPARTLIASQTSLFCMPVPVRNRPTHRRA